MDSAAREALAAAASGGSGDALDGAVKVTVDGKGLLASAEFSPDIARSSPEDLRVATLSALEAARAATGLKRSAPSAPPSRGPLSAHLNRLLEEQQ